MRLRVLSIGGLVMNMKHRTILTGVALLALSLSVRWSSVAQGDVVGFQNNLVILTFDDTAAGGGLYGGGVEAFQRAPGANTLGPITDAVTGDTGSLTTWFDFGATSYFAYQGGSLTQPAGVNGVTKVSIDYQIDFLLDGGGLPAHTTFLGYTLAGNVLAGGFVEFEAQLLITSLMTGDSSFLTVAYAQYVPGAFNVDLLALGAMPALPANDTILVDGFVELRGDPFSAGFQPVPEPGNAFAVLALFAIAAVYGCGRHRRTCRTNMTNDGTS